MEANRDRTDDLLNSDTVPQEIQNPDIILQPDKEVFRFQQHAATQLQGCV